MLTLVIFSLSAGVRSGRTIPRGRFNQGDTAVPMRCHGSGVGPCLRGFGGLEAASRAVAFAATVGRGRFVGPLAEVGIPAPMAHLPDTTAVTQRAGMGRAACRPVRAPSQLHAIPGTTRGALEDPPPQDRQGRS